MYILKSIDFVDTIGHTPQNMILVLFGFVVHNVRRNTAATLLLINQMKAVH